MSTELEQLHVDETLVTRFVTGLSRRPSSTRPSGLLSDVASGVRLLAAHLWTRGVAAHPVPVAAPCEAEQWLQRFDDHLVQAHGCYGMTPCQHSCVRQHLWSPGAPGSVGHQPKSGPPKRRTIEGRFDDESRCYSVIITVSRDSARMTVIRRESGPSWSRELGAAAPSGSHCHVARSPDRASDRSPSRRPLLRPLHVSGQFLAGSLLSAI